MENNKNNPEIIRIGKYSVSQHDETSVWIQSDDGEAGAFSEYLFELAIKEFFDKNL